MLCGEVGKLRPVVPHLVQFEFEGSGRAWDRRAGNVPGRPQGDRTQHPTVMIETLHAKHLEILGRMRRGGSHTARHSAYRSQFVVVAYPWHPLHDQRVRVYGRQRRAGRQIVYVEVRPGFSREIPAWMCDSAECTAISRGPARVSAAALIELRAVLDTYSTARRSDRSLSSSTAKGGSNETSLCSIS